MFARFFIDRPIFASVLSIVITLAGGISVFTLPLAQFPRIAPPTVTVSCSYPGASAQDVAEAVAAPIEQFINGVEGMMYMSSQCTNDGTYNLTVTFHQGVDIDMAQVQVQNRVSLAIPSLPDVIKATGVATRKRSGDILMGIALYSPKGRFNQLYMSNYALRRIKDELARVEGVGDVFLFGQRDFSMRIWVDPAKLAYRNLTAADVVASIREQNAQIATGMIGQPPTPEGQQVQITLDLLGRLKDVEQFENIIVKVGSQAPVGQAASLPEKKQTANMPENRQAGSLSEKRQTANTANGQAGSLPYGVVRLKDVARVELGPKNQDVHTHKDGKPTVFLVIFHLPEANALETHDRVLAKMEELKKDFPEDIAYDVGFNTTPYTRESIREVFHTLQHAIILVALVVLLFLQNWRSAIIPLIAVPVAIIGTFAVMAAMGFSLNNLTLFGLVLAIGIVVDDAIVVVEAVEHHIEQGLSPHEASIKAMDQVSGPVMAVGLVLSAVFIPCAFISGLTGLFFRQFALTIAVSTIISTFNSLTLSPALCALLLRPLASPGQKGKMETPPLPRWFFPILGGSLGYFLFPEAEEVWGMVLGATLGWLLSRPLNRLLFWTFRKFNLGFGHAITGYTNAVGKILHLSGVGLAVYAGLLVLTYFGFTTTARGFIPSQDMGYLMVNVLLPDSASLERTQEVMMQADKITRSHPAVKHATAIAGQSFALSAAGSNFGSMFVNLKEYSQRRDPSHSSEAVAAYLRKRFQEEIYDATIAVFGPPPIRNVGRAGGFAFVLEDRGDLGPAELQKQADRLAFLGNNPRLARAIQKGYSLDSENPGQLEAALDKLAWEHPDLEGKPPLVGLFTVFRANVPQVEIRPDPREITARKVRVEDAAATLSVFQGSLYVNDFNLLGRTWQVIVQADAPFRDRQEALFQLKTRNAQGAMVPGGSLGSIQEKAGPLALNRYNMYPAATINGLAGPGTSSGQAIDLMQRLAARELPQAMAYEWTDMSYLELQAGNTALVLFSLAVVMVFLLLAAQYESWSLPLAVILVVPLCLLSAIVGVRMADMDINIFTQIGFVVLVGLTSKNAILIVEYAKKQREAGVPRVEATLAACRLRLRPIIMTSLAFILGVVPLMISTGAGAEMRRTLGVAVFSGMLGVTFFGIFLTPVFFFLIDRLGESPWLNSPFMRRLRRWSLDILALGYVRKWVTWAWRWRENNQPKGK